MASIKHPEHSKEDVLRRIGSWRNEIRILRAKQEAAERKIQSFEQLIKNVVDKYAARGIKLEE